MRYVERTSAVRMGGAGKVSLIARAAPWSWNLPATIVSVWLWPKRDKKVVDDGRIRSRLKKRARTPAIIKVVWNTKRNFFRTLGATEKLVQPSMVTLGEPEIDDGQIK